MFRKKISLIIFVLVLSVRSICAQELTGCWEGDIESNNEFLQINIVETGGKLCGYTWDYSHFSKASQCRAYFVGTYDKSNKTYFLDGTSFMENTGGHVLMQMKILLVYEKGTPFLVGYLRTKGSFFFGAGEISKIRLRKVSKKPERMTQAMKDCVAENTPKPKPAPVTRPLATLQNRTAPSEVVPKKKDSIITIPQQVTPKKDTIAITPDPPVVKIPPGEQLLSEKMRSRATKEMGNLILNEKQITLNVYDNGTIDGDTVSIFYNNRLLLSHRKLSSQPITVSLTLDENTTTHRIALFAENLGSIPPNTALVILTTPKGRRYELFSSATLEQNAVLVFEYKPL